MSETDRNNVGVTTAVVTGGNRGIGLEVCRQLAGEGVRVILTSRDPKKGSAAAARLMSDGLNVNYRPLDVSDPKSRAEFADYTQRELKGLDILVNNAGISLDGFNAQVAEKTLTTNFFSVVALTDTLLPLIRPHGRVVMVSSGMGALSCLSPALRREFLDPALTRERLFILAQRFIEDVKNNRHEGEGWPSSAYSVSKVCLNALTRVLKQELERGPENKQAGGFIINAVCPGWVRTGMGGKFAPRAVNEGARGIVWAATLPPDGPTGKFFRDKREQSW